MGRFLNAKRLRDYPRLFLLAMVAVLAGNVLLGEGWQGASGQIIGNDFLMLYSSGVLFREAPEQLYDFERQEAIQHALVAPAPMWGFVPFNYPPYVALVTSFVSHIPLGWAFGLWSLATVVFAGLAVGLMSRKLVSPELRDKGLTPFQLMVVTYSFFPFIEGLQVGQNHGLTLLLTVGILAAMLDRRWFIAGLLAGISIYKPQFGIGFLILWMVWGRWQALAGFGLAAGAWGGALLAQHGAGLYFAYLEKLPLLLQMLYLEGFGTYLEVTPYGLLAALLPPAAWQSLATGWQVVNLALAVGLGVYAGRVRNRSAEQQVPAMLLAVLFPLLAAPHTLLHDLVVIVPVMILWARQQPKLSRNLLYAAVLIYLACFFAPYLAYASGIPALALIPVGLAGWLGYDIYQTEKNQSATTIVER